MQQGSIGEDSGVEWCWAALTFWQAVSFLWTAHCADATSKHEDKRHYSTQRFPGDHSAEYYSRAHKS